MLILFSCSYFSQTPNPKILEIDQSLCIEDILALGLLLFIFSRWFVFPDSLVTLDRFTGLKSVLCASMSSKFWILLERVQHEIHIFITPGNSRGFVSVSNSTNCLVCMIGSIKNWPFCFPEATDLNQEGLHNWLWEDTSFQKVFEDLKLSLSQLSFTKWYSL